ncbi:MAG: hypothetical protein AB7Q97_09620 [Gammaproteobacteria bacterium]
MIRMTPTTRTLPPLALAVFAFAQSPPAAAFCPNTNATHPALGCESIENPSWRIELTDYGYADILVEKDQPLYFREYLSGEWAGALTYTAGEVTESRWLEPEFIFPDWTTNSDFAPIAGITATGANNADGFPIYESTVANPSIRVRQTFQMLDSLTGIEQGLEPALSGADPGTGATSNRYVLRQTYEITNVSGGAISDLRLFQFLHGLNSEVSLFDNRDYGGAFGAYRYDTTQVGTVRAVVDLDADYDSPERFAILPNALADFGVTDDMIRSWLGKDAEFIKAELAKLFIVADEIAVLLSTSEAYQVNVDTIAFHSAVAPDAFENGPYGLQSAGDCHEGPCGKPGIGVHLSVEGGALDGITDFFAPGEFWVSGGQQFNFGTLGDGESVSIDFLLSIGTDQSVAVVPLPPALVLFLPALAGLATLRRT